MPKSVYSNRWVVDTFHDLDPNSFCFQTVTPDKQNKGNGLEMTLMPLHRKIM